MFRNRLVGNFFITLTYFIMSSCLNTDPDLAHLYFNEASASIVFEDGISLSVSINARILFLNPLSYFKTGISKSVHDGKSGHKKSTGLHGSTAHHSGINKVLDPFKWCANSVPFTKRCGAQKQSAYRVIRHDKMLPAAWRKLDRLLSLIDKRFHIKSNFEISEDMAANAF